MFGYYYYYLFFPRKPAATFCTFEQHVGCRFSVGRPDPGKYFKTPFVPTNRSGRSHCASLLVRLSSDTPLPTRRIIWKTKKITNSPARVHGKRTSEPSLSPTAVGAAPRMEGLNPRRRSRGSMTHARHFDPRRFEVFRNDHSSSTAAPLVTAAALMIARVLNRIFPRALCTLGPTRRRPRKPNNGSLPPPIFSPAVCEIYNKIDFETYAFTVTGGEEKNLQYFNIAYTST